MVGRVILLIFVACAFLAIAQGNPAQEPEKTALELKIAIESTQFCQVGPVFHGSTLVAEVDKDTYGENFKLATRYTNKGETPVTIFVGSDAVAVTRVARSVEDMSAGRYEFEYNEGPLFGGDGKILGEDLKREHPKVLAPGESVDGESGAVVFVGRSELVKLPKTVTSGKHFLRVEALVRVPDKDTADQQKRGQGQEEKFHWISVPSQVIPFEVPVNPKLEDCSPKSNAK